MSDRTPSRVRAFLREELPRWRAEGILDERGAETLARRYLAGPEATGVALAALYVLAAAMVGAGIVSLVAWHWDELPRAVRLAILGTALVAAHGVGFWMWQVRRRRPRLGHAVSLLGTLIFGASIGLVAQLFHVSGPWYGLFGAWALGALCAGLALPSLPALGLALVLGLFCWAPGFVSDHGGAGDAVAWLAGGAGLALAFRSRSRVLFLLATAGLGAALGTAAAQLPAPRWSAPAYVLGALLALTAATSAFGWFRWHGAPHRFAPAAATLGRLALYVLGYWLSFGDGARAATHEAGWSRAWLTCALPPLAVALALQVAGRASAEDRARRATAFAATLLAAAYPVLVLAHAPPVWLAAAANAALLAVAGIQVAHGLQTRRRAPFWDGLAAASVVACSRFFEIDELLWLKGLGFVACGVAVTAAALAFERRLQARGTEVHHA